MKEPVQVIISLERLQQLEALEQQTIKKLHNGLYWKYEAKTPAYSYASTEQTPFTGGYRYVNDPNAKWGIRIVAATKWYYRLWFLVSNPFRYLFTGKIVYFLIFIFLFSCKDKDEPETGCVTDTYQGTTAVFCMTKSQFSASYNTGVGPLAKHKGTFQYCSNCK